VDPVPDPLLFFSGSAGNRTWASGSVAKNSDHYTTEAVSASIISQFNSILMEVAVRDFFAKLWILRIVREMTGWVSNSVSTSILLSLYPFECFIFLL
jgi:hypothetical protein